MPDSNLLTPRTILYLLLGWVLLWTASCSLTSLFERTFLSQPTCAPASAPSGPDAEFRKLYEMMAELVREQKILAGEFGTLLAEDISINGTPSCECGNGQRRRGWKLKRRDAWANGDIETEVWL
ncbi:hypothetical protein M430DRAFT_33857 [Amorphotheca resinae ATCC 22711]|uniref:Uncharacterized protein n=1 Tax=Amorphotheca resinae ATCC 22711 TaxID=857342 RepID=A0A2T3B943_AMORE|nr:hypothetical protein M430DRAFT_33857 [Amorphotheca resinae ATCC 22711]PSS23347.1 hypothetical protein M430DRAFT_33857 [Amorphotheca resinae ATCC 22711]